MGIINHDPYENRFTVEPIVDTYIDIGSNQLSFTKNEAGFTAASTFAVYYSYEAWAASKEAISMEYIEVSLTSDDLKRTDAYTIIYDALKKKFPNYTDR